MMPTARIPPTFFHRHSRTARGFTLVELLVVIGIIALLISILLPALSKARESANKVKCLSNIRQIVMAFSGYTQDNRGAFPFMALAGGNPYEEDWIWWQKTNNRINDIGFHGIGPYLNLSKTSNVLYCPADDVTFRARQNGPPPDPYPFSYSLNNCFTSAWNNTVPKLHAGGSWGGLGGSEDLCIAAKITQVKDTADKILIFEEDERTIDDGNGSLYCVPAHLHFLNLLALRHDRDKRKVADVPPADNGTVPNPDGKGCVGFCDGHADYVERAYAHSKKHGVRDATLLPLAWQ
jgi:prepilin-type N-terminal cleavage/methylation domain-containing protein